MMREPAYELSRLGYCPDPAELQSAGVDSLVVHCSSSPEFLVKVEGVLREIFRTLAETPELIYAPDSAHWRDAFPAWFLRRFCSVDELRVRANSERLSKARFEGVDPDERWALESWLPWFEPDDRPWYWFGACVIDNEHVRIYILADDYPILVDSLEWFLYQCGGIEIEREW